MHINFSLSVNPAIILIIIVFSSHSVDLGYSYEHATSLDCSVTVDPLTIYNNP